MWRMRGRWRGLAVVLSLGIVVLLMATSIIEVLTSVQRRRLVGRRVRREVAREVVLRRLIFSRCRMG